MKLHPFVAKMVESMANMPAFSDMTPQDARAAMAAGRAALGSGPDLASIRDVSIASRGGPLRARVYVPKGTPRGIVVYLHGGGWVLGSIEDFDTYARSLAAASEAVVVLPEYRLSPEYPYPAALEDTEDTLKWVYERRGNIIKGNSALVVAGDSAGANLATVAARQLAGTIPLALQVLYYPVTDCDFDRPSYRTHGQGLPLKAQDMTWFFKQYSVPESWADPTISPLRSNELDSLPPTILVTAEFDVLADEGRAYAEKLKAAGVQVTSRELAGLTHGFVRLHNLLEPSREELIKVGQEIRDALKSAGCASQTSKTAPGIVEFEHRAHDRTVH